MISDIRLRARIVFGPTKGRGDTVIMPTEVENAAKSLEPVRMGKPLQHFLWTKFVQNRYRDFPGEFDHDLEKLGRSFALM
jgi:hypothetical protein